MSFFLHLYVSKASGPNRFSPHLLKEGVDILAYPFSYVFNRSLNQEYFPHSWKEANVSPIFKTDKLFLLTGASFVDHLCYLCLVFVMLSRLLIAALWSPEWEWLTSWLLFVMFIVILLLSKLVSWDRCCIDCIDS